MKHISVVFFIVCGTSAFAQFSKGDKAVGGELSLSARYAPKNSQGHSWRYTNVEFDPKFGIFVDENLAIGGLLGYSYGIETTSTSDSVPDYKSGYQGFSIGLYENKYFQIAENFFFSLLGKAEYRYTKRFSKAAGLDSQAFSREFKVNFSPNLIFFPAPNWALTANLGGVEYSYTRKADTSKSHEFNVKLGQSFSLGLSYYFRK